MLHIKIQITSTRCKLQYTAICINILWTKFTNLGSDLHDGIMALSNSVHIHRRSHYNNLKLSLHMYLEGSESTDIQIQNGTNRHSVMFTYLGPRGILQNWRVIPTRYRIHRRNTGVHTSKLWIYVICRIINFCRWKHSTDWFVRIGWYCWAVWYRLCIEATWVHITCTTILGSSLHRWVKNIWFARCGAGPTCEQFT